MTATETNNTSKLTIAYFVVDNSLYGSNRALLLLINQLKNANTISPVVFMAKTGPFSDQLAKHNIPCHTIRFFYSIYPETHSIKDLFLFLPRLMYVIFGNLFAFTKIVWNLHREKPHLIHTNTGPIHLGYWTSKFLNIPHIWHIREYHDAHFKWHAIPSNSCHRKMMKNSGTFPITITKALLHHYNLGNRANHIYDMVEKSTAETLSVEKEKYFLYVGRLEEKKGVMLLLEAYNQCSLARQRHKLIIVGNGSTEFKNKIDKYIRMNELGSKVKLLGFIPNPSGLMSHATALIIPSQHEGMGLVAIEAMFSKCLVVGHNSGGLKELLMENQNGLLFNTIDELSEILRKVATAGDQFSSQINKAHQFVCANFDNTINARKVYDHYLTALNSH